VIVGISASVFGNLSLKNICCFICRGQAMGSTALPGSDASCSFSSVNLEGVGVFQLFFFLILGLSYQF
jgi:hypothetical protein